MHLKATVRSHPQQYNAIQNKKSIADCDVQNPNKKYFSFLEMEIVLIYFYLGILAIVCSFH